MSAAGNDVEARIAAIKKAMGDGSYWQDEKMQAEYLRLLTERDAQAASPAKHNDTEGE